MSLKEKVEAISSKIILLVIACGVWVIVLQNAGVIPTSQNVYVTGGYVDGSVSVRNTVDIRGSVDVDNTVDVNLKRINGKRNAFYDFEGDQNYVRIPVYTGTW